MNSLRIIDACTEEHFAAMSRIHARGWHAAYPGHVPDDYLRDVITEDHWIPFFREDYATGRCRGLLLYDGENPVCCCTCGPVRLGRPTGAGGRSSPSTPPPPAPAEATARC